MIVRILFLGMLLVSYGVYAQSKGKIWEGKIKDANGESLPGAIIRIDKIKKYAVADRSGRFLIGPLSEGRYLLEVSHIGYKPLAQEVTLKEPLFEIVLTLQQVEGLLSEVKVMGKSETQQARLQPIKAEIINTKVVQEQPATLVELMNRSAGIRIRQTGGLGSDAGLMMNGFQGRAIKNFKDGIPMDYLGAAYNIALVPVNMLERVEVYKGVLPASLGADALGGAVNMVTKKALYRYAEASYEVASFNTHRLSLNALYTDTTRKFFVGADAFVNSSDNNYNVRVNVIDQETATQRPATVRLFHNHFTNYYTEVYGGISNVGWADELRVGITGFYIHRQNQYGASMSQPFGASVSRQYSIIPTLRFRKRLGAVNIDQFLTVSTIHTQQTDTTKGTYDWYGNFIPSPSRLGEISVRGSLADIDFSYFTSRTHVAYDFQENNTLEFNVVSAKSGRIGQDSLALRSKSGRDLLTVPAHYYKFIAAVGLVSKDIFRRFSNHLIAKVFYYKTNALDADWVGNEFPRSFVSTRWGIAEALKMNLNEGAFLRFSAEAATRLPEQDELFGDGNFHLSNFELRPERSTNLNLGFRTDKPGNYSVEINSFYRLTRDLILKVPVNIFFTQNQNVNNVKGWGIEADAMLSLTRWLKANTNFTYQDFRLFDTGNRVLEGSRLRNTPYFFANVGINTSFQDVLLRQDKLQLYYFYTFVREYYLDYVPKSLEPSGVLGLWGKAQFDAPNIIPNQHIHVVGFTYRPKISRLTLGFQIKNLFNTAQYDHFRVQNAGRSLHLKLNFTIK